jgi:hypothetical protein
MLSKLGPAFVTFTVLLPAFATTPSRAAAPARSVAASSLAAAAATSRASPPFRRTAPARARARASTDVTEFDALARRPAARETRPARATSRRWSFAHLFVPIAAAAPRGAPTACGIARAVDVDDVRVSTCARDASRTVVRARVCWQEARWSPARVKGFPESGARASANRRA